MSTNSSGYTQTVVSTPTAPSTSSVFDYDLQFPLYRDIVADGFIEEPMFKKEMTSAKSFFTGNSLIASNVLLSNLRYGQEVTVYMKKDQNPFSLFQKDDLEYAANEGDACHSHVVLNCTVPCINTLPSYNSLKFRFDCEYAYGVRMCDKNRDFFEDGEFTRQYALSKAACEFGKEVDLWNKVIDGLITSPATTVDAKLAGVHSTHYWDNQGTVATNARKKIPEAVSYLTSSFANINPTLFITPEFATELIRSVESVYNINFSNTVVDTYKQWEVPGFTPAPEVQRILGLNIPVVIMEKSPWLTTSTTSEAGTTYATQYPLWKADGTKQYAALLDPRVGYFFEKDGYHLNIRPYDCDKLYVGMIDTTYVGEGITFPVYGMVLEFDPFVYD